MGLRRTKINENDATSFHSLACGAAKPTVFFSYPCSLNQWLFSQEFPMGLQRTKVDENSEFASSE